MNHSSAVIDHKLGEGRRSLRIGWLLVAAGCLLTLALHMTLVTAHAQTPTASLPVSGLDPLQKLRDEYERSDIKENFPRYAAFAILRPYLPVGTRFTSGFRTPQDQLGVIRRLAEQYNGARPGDKIPLLPGNASVNASSTWQPTLQALRDRGFFVASPLSTPHGTTDVVFDMGGANLAAIMATCDRAEKMGLMTFRKKLPEPVNNAVHVEVDKIGAKAMMLLGTGSVLPTNASGSSSTTDPDEAKKKNQLLQYLLEQHDKETDPSRQIELDRARIKLLPADEISKIAPLEEEIKQHEQKLEELKTQGQKKAALEEISNASQEGQYPQALQLARDFAQKFPGDPTAEKQVARVEALLGFEQAIDLVIREKWACDQCQEAQEEVNQALKLAQSIPLQIQGAENFKSELDNHLKWCLTRFIVIIILGVTLTAGLLIGLFFLLRPGKWALECVTGSCQGEVFPLDKEDIRIGALGPPDGEADIVICDAKRKISRLHCVIRQVGRKYYLKDESANGTSVNGQALGNSDYHHLRKGDEISLAGEAELIFRPQ